MPKRGRRGGEDVGGQFQHCDRSEGVLLVHRLAPRLGRALSPGLLFHRVTAHSLTQRREWARRTHTRRRTLQLAIDSSTARKLSSALPSEGTPYYVGWPQWHSVAPVSLTFVGIGSDEVDR